MKIILFAEFLKTQLKTQKLLFLFIKKNKINYIFTKLLIKYILYKDTNIKYISCKNIIIDKIINKKKFNLIFILKYFSGYNKSHILSKIIDNASIFLFYEKNYLGNKKFYNTYVYNVKHNTYEYKIHISLTHKCDIINILYYLLFRLIKKKNKKNINYLLKLTFFLIKYKKVLKKNPSLDVFFLINLIKKTICF